jgi:hypothetical protein
MTTDITTPIRQRYDAATGERLRVPGHLNWRGTRKCVLLETEDGIPRLVTGHEGGPLVQLVEPEGGKVKLVIGSQDVHRWARVEALHLLECGGKVLLVTVGNFMEAYVHVLGDAPRREPEVLRSAVKRG